ncbi:MAG: hypothetical protein PWR02_1501 [Synergistales bacterium]|nr:hypothetical protein [Synergistales bacterium]
MIARVPKGVYTMNDKHAIIKHNARAYQKGSKKTKSLILEDLSALLHMNRQYLAFLLRNTGRVVMRKGRIVVVSDPCVDNTSRRGRKKVYGHNVLEALKKIWPLTGFASSKHLVAFIRLNHEVLFAHPRFRDNLNDRTRGLLLKISAATADRLLKPYRDSMKLKKRYRGNPFSSNLKRSIKVEAWYDNRPKEPGYVEIDLVQHSGASGKGEFAYTLTATETSTGWTELRALKNKAMVWTRLALEEVVEAMPLPVKRFHSDNGSEFINSHVKRFCEERGIDFTRSRPYTKNDAPYVESRNWSMVRAYVGWRRYDTDEERDTLERLGRLISLRQNLFMPHMRLVAKKREGGKVRKIYDTNTPFNRVMQQPILSDTTREKLMALKNSIDIVKLSEEIEKTSAELSRLYERKLRRLNYD